MRKFLISLIVIFLFTSFSYSGYYLECGGSYSTLIMDSYNSDIDKATVMYQSLGLILDFNKITGAPVLFWNGVIPFQTDAGLWAFVFCNEFIFVNNKNYAYFSYGKKYIETDESYNITYFGVGGRKYFFNEISTGKILPYIGIDCGLGYTLGNYSKFNAYYPDGSILEYVYADMSGIMLGFRGEFGCEVWFNNSLGMFLQIGGRYMRGELSGEAKSLGVLFPVKDNVKQAVDYSGLFFKAGIIFGFDMKIEHKNETINDKDKINEISKINIEDKDDLPVLSEDTNYKELVNKGEDEYKVKRYKIAVTYFEEAVKIYETAEIYKKIGNCYYYLGNKTKAIKAYEKSLELNPYDKKIIELLKKYKTK